MRTPIRCAGSESNFFKLPHPYLPKSAPSIGKGHSNWSQDKSLGIESHFDSGVTGRLMNTCFPLVPLTHGFPEGHLWSRTAPSQAGKRAAEFTALSLPPAAPPLATAIAAPILLALSRRSLCARHHPKFFYSSIYWFLSTTLQGREWHYYYLYFVPEEVKAQPLAQSPQRSNWWSLDVNPSSWWPAQLWTTPGHCGVDGRQGANELMLPATLSFFFFLFLFFKSEEVNCSPSVGLLFF